MMMPDTLFSDALAKQPGLHQKYKDIQDRLKNRYDLLPDQLALIEKVSALSDFFYDYLLKDVSNAMVASGDLFNAYRAEEYTARAERLDQQDLDQALRQYRNYEMARIIFRDFSRLADLVQTTRDLSGLADSCIEIALKFHYDKNVARFGQPVDRSGKAQQMTVLGLGKLGAQELNVSSDIDLIFFYNESGEVMGESGVSNQEFFIRTSRQLIKTLDEPTASGFVFRVDMRLRPYGESSPLIMNRTSMEKYFFEQGRDWERYAFVKARSVAGDKNLGRAFLEWMKPFVFRPLLDFGAIESLRDMKRLINTEVTRKSLGDDVKLGPGGIREAEFIVQAQQLVWGGKKPVLQQRRILESLDCLAREDLMPADEVERLKAAYTFLRNTEHFIQGEGDRQSQRLPTNDISILRLALVMGFSSVAAFEAELKSQRGFVASRFEEFLGVGATEEFYDGVVMTDWVSAWQHPEAAQEFLVREGFVDVKVTIPLLKGLLVTVEQLQDVGLERAHKLVPRLLLLCSREVNCDEVLGRVCEILSSIVRRSTYLSFLLENNDATKRLVLLSAMSEWVVHQIGQFPILLYELTDRSNDLYRLQDGALKSELNSYLAEFESDDLEGQMDALRQFRHSACLRVAIFELLGILSTMEASDSLTKIAELVLNRVTELAMSYLIARHGLPCAKSGAPFSNGIAVIGYGKLGGIELGYGSDLDIVLLHDGDMHGETNGDKPIPNGLFYSRLGQRIVHILTSFTRFGCLYEIDLRLRPDGNKGSLMRSMASFEQYLKNDAWTWEHQALVRSRFVAGDQRLTNRFESIRQDVLTMPRDLVGLRQKITDMRKKMRDSIKSGVTKSEVPELVFLADFDLKHATGAIVDVEFLVQYLILANSSVHPSLCKWTDKIRLIQSLAEVGLLETGEADSLREAYLGYRSAAHYKWLGGQIDSYEPLNQSRAAVVEIWHNKLEL
ncbi:MAG: bifunctional [glutamate--ammonia ligase]-adenylyl-L-tyrosine phosphorylase/[glutamate--ammonia-ligase] adenylyltransferase [Pseudomonadales bacterium]